jgi:lysophospholipase L1-like esterase
MNWFDCLELAWKVAEGKSSVFINSGRGGDTTDQVLERLERDCLRYAPHFVILTIGGNDSNPSRGMPINRYQENLERMVHEIRKIGGEPILQTYYAPDIAKMQPGRAEIFQDFMEAMRGVARRSDCPLIDHLARWELLRDKHYPTYESLMLDPMHTNPIGNLVLGLDVVREFGLQLPSDPFYEKALAVQSLMDAS